MRTAGHYKRMAEKHAGISASYKAKAKAAPLRSRPVTISFDDFLSLKSGDFVVWRGKYLRTVVIGPADAKFGRHYNRDAAQGHPHVEFPRKAFGGATDRNGRRITYKSLTVGYFYNDIKRFIKKASRRIRALALASEVEALKALGLNVRRQMLDEIRAQAETNERMGYEPCKCWDRIKKLSREPLPTAETYLLEAVK